MKINRMERFARAIADEILARNEVDIGSSSKYCEIRLVMSLQI